MGLDSGYIDTELKTLSLRVNRETSTNQQILVDLINCLPRKKQYRYHIILIIYLKLVVGLWAFGIP